MAAYHDIFVKPKVADADLVSDLEKVLGAEAQDHTDGGEGQVLVTKDAFVDLYLSHDLVDTGSLHFSQYPHYITVRDRDRDQARSEQLARTICSGLTSTNRYDCFIVWNDTELVGTDDQKT
ncbi:MAG: hypothetical protein ACJ72N_01020 [Labedaea sp.]